MILRIGTLLKAAPLRAPIRLPAGRLSPVTDPADKLKLSQGKLFTFCNRRSESAQALTLTKSGKSHRDSSQASAVILIGNENGRTSQAIEYKRLAMSPTGVLTGRPYP